MKVQEAEKIYRELKKGVSKSDVLQLRDDKKQLEEKIHKLFVPSVFGRHLVKRSSLKGKIYAHFQRKQTQSEQINRIKNIFNFAKEAIDQTESSTIPLYLRTLSHQFLYEMPAGCLTETNQHLQELHESKIEMEKSVKNKNHRNSLFRKLKGSLDPVITPTQFQEFLDTFSSFKDSSLQDLKTYLEQNSKFASPRAFDHFKLIENAFAFSRKVESSLRLLATQPIERVAKRKEYAEKISATIGSLKTNESWLLCAKFGRDVRSFDQMLQFGRNMTPTKCLDENASEFLTTYGPLLNSPANFIESKVHDLMKKIKNEILPGFVESNEFSMVESLLENKQKPLPESLQSIIPKPLHGALLSWFQQGLIGNAMEFVSDGPVRELFLLLSENGMAIKDPQQSAIYLQQIEDWLIQAIKPTISQADVFLKGASDSLIKEAKLVIPAFVQERIATDLFATPLWIKIVKTDDKYYQLLDYHSGLCIKKLTIEQLDESFFDALLMHTFEPQFNLEFQSKREDIYDGIFATLGGIQQTIANLSTSLAIDDEEMLQKLVIHESYTIQHVDFERLYEKFISFCKPLLDENGENLQIHSSEIAGILTDGISLLIKKAKQLPEDIRNEKLITLYATQSEITLAILTFQQSTVAPLKTVPEEELQLPEAFLRSLAAIVTPYQIRQAKASLLWALGDDIEPLLDAVIDSLEALPPLETPKKNVAADAPKESIFDNLFTLPIKKRPKGWLRTLLFSIYWKWIILGLQTAYYLTRAYQVGVMKIATPYILDYLKTHRKELIAHLPQAVQDVIQTIEGWYEAIKIEAYTQIFLLLAKACEQIVLFGLKSFPKDEDYFRHAIRSTNDWKNQLGVWSKRLMGNETIDLSVKNSITNAPISELTLPDYAEFPIVLTQSFSWKPFPAPAHVYKKQQANEDELKNFTVQKIKNDFQNLFQDTEVSMTMINENKKVHNLQTDPRLLANLHQIMDWLFSLPNPLKNNENDPWKAITNNKESLDTLLDCFNSLNDRLILLFEEVEQIPSQTLHLYTTLLAAISKSLMIVDTLARSHPQAQLDGFEVNYYTLLKWFKSHASCLENPEIIQQFEAFCHYFAPGLDLFNLPPMKELSERGASCLFYYESNRGSSSTLTPHFSKIENKWKEFSYLKILLAQPEILELITQYTNGKLEDPRQYLIYLFEEQNYRDYQAVKLIPSAYHYLRHQTLSLNRMIAHGGQGHRIPSSTTTFSDPKISYCNSDNESWDFLDRKQQKNGMAQRLDRKSFSLDTTVFPIFLSELRQKYQDKLYDELWIKNCGTIPNPFKKVFYPTVYHRIPQRSMPKLLAGHKSVRFIGEPSRNQSRIIAHPAKNKINKGIFNEGDSKFREVETYARGGIVRLVDYFSENKEALGSLEALTYLRWKFFKGVELANQLREAPEFAETLASFFAQSIAYFVLNQRADTAARLGFIGLKVATYCEHYEPQSAIHFTQIRQTLRKVLKNTLKSEMRSWLLVLNSLYCGDYSAKAEDDYVDDAAIIAEAFFCPTVRTLMKNADENKHHQLIEIFAEFGAKFNSWHPLIEGILSLSDEEMDFSKERQKILERMLDCNGIPFLPHMNQPLKSFDSDYDFERIFTLGPDLVIDFKRGIVQPKDGMQQVIDVEKLKLYLAPLELDLTDLKRVNLSTFSTANEDVIIHVAEEEYHYKGAHIIQLGDIEAKSTVEISKKYEGKYFKLVKYERDTNQTEWLENSNGELIEYLQFEKNQLIKRCLIRRESPSSDNYFVELQYCHGGFSQKISVDSIKSLAPINTFCPLSEIECWKEPKSCHIDRLLLKPFGLEFEVKEVKGRLRAFLTQQFAGYYLAENQNHPALKNFSGTLLLENESHQKKVLIADKSAAASVIWPFVAAQGSIAHILAPFMDMLPYCQSATNGNSFFAFDLDNNGLMSTEAHALSFLLKQSLFQRDFDLTECVINQIEWVAKREALSLNMDDLILCMSLIPTSYSPKMRIARQKLIATLEENRQLRQTFPGEVPVETSHKTLLPPTIENSLLMITMIRDLLENDEAIDPRDKLNASQEWMVYQALTCRMSTFAHEMGVEKIQNMMNYFPFKLSARAAVEDGIYQAILPYNCFERYSALKKEFGSKDTLLDQSIKICKRIYSTPPEIYEKVLNECKKLDSTRQADFNEQLNPVEYFSVGNELVQLGQTVADHYLSRFSWNTETLDEFFESRDFVINDNPPTDHLFDRECLIRHFFSYYHLMRKPQNRQKVLQLERLLLLNKSGWDVKSRCLIAILQGLSTFPRAFPSNKTLLALLSSECSVPDIKKDEIRDAAYFESIANKYKNKFVDFFNKIEKRAQQIAIATPGLTAASKLIANISTYNSNTSSPAKLLGLTNFTLGRLSLAEKIGRTTIGYCREFLETSEIQPVVIPQITLADHQFLIQIDKTFDALFDDLFALAFTEQSVAKLETPEMSAFKTSSTAELIEEVNQSLSDYQNRSSAHTYLHLKSKADLYKLYVSLNHHISRLERQLLSERDRLLSVVNSDHSNLSRPLTFDDLISYFLNGNFNDYQGVILLPSNQLKNLEIVITHDLISQTRLQQLKRCYNHLNALISLSHSKEPILFEEKTENLAIELKSRRAYDFGGKQPIRLVRRLLMFEYVMNVGLWQKQVDSLTDFLIKNEGSSFNELLMSLGKSWFIASTAATYEAGGNLESNNPPLVVHLWTKSLFASNVRLMSQQSRNVFHHHTRALEFNRQKGLTKETLEACLFMQNQAIKNGDTLNMTPEDIQTLDHFLFEKLYLRSKYKAKSDGTLMRLKTILSKFLNSGLLIGDEAHELLDEKAELNWPVGEAKTIEACYVNVMEDCFKALFDIPGAKDIINGYDRALAHDLYESEWKEKIAVKMVDSKLYAANTDFRRKLWIKYVTGKTIKTPQWILEHVRFKEITMVKGMLSTLIPTALLNAVNVDYGLSKTTNDEFAKVAKGNDNICENATNRIPYEIFLKTIFMWISKGLRVEMAHKLLNYLYQAAKTQSKLKPCLIEETDAYHEYRLLGIEANFDFASLEQTLPSQEVVNEICLSSKAIFLYVRLFVTQQIKYFKDNIRTNALDFSSMFNKKYFLSGTPYNKGVYPSDLKPLLDPGTNGEAIAILRQKVPADGIHDLQSSEPKQVLQEVLNKYFMPESGFTALIDGGAQLNGLSNRYVVDQLAAHIKIHRPDILAIDFFENNQLVSLVVRSNEVILHDLCKIPLHAKLSYFDQSHGFGANIPQKFNGKGLLLVGPTHQLYKLLQEVFRMRGIKVFRKLLGVGKKTVSASELKESLLTTTQIIHLALTPQTKKAILKTNISDEKITEITLEQILLFCIINENCQLKSSHFQAYGQKVDSIVRHAIRKKILQASSEKMMSEIFEDFFDVFIKKLEDDTRKLYGFVQRPVETSIVLKAKRKNAIERIANSRWFSKLEQQAINDEIEALPVPPMNETMLIYTDGKGNYIDLSEDSGKQTETQTSSQAETQTDSQIETDIQTQQNTMTENALAPVKISDFEEWKWPKQMDVDSMQWLEKSLSGFNLNKESFSWLSQIDKLRKSKKPVEEIKIEPPPVFSLKTLLKQHPCEQIRAVSDAFDERIWLSNNFLPRLTRKSSEMVFNVGDKGQRSLNEVLVYLKETDGGHEILSVGCLSIKDADKWRKRLKGRYDCQSKKELKVILYHVGQRTVVGGDYVNLEALHKNEDFVKIIECQLKFINGDVKYHKKQLDVLGNWLYKNELAKMSTAFEAIYFARGTQNRKYSNIHPFFEFAKNT